MNEMQIQIHLLTLAAKGHAFGEAAHAQELAAKDQQHVQAIGALKAEHEKAIADALIEIAELKARLAAVADAPAVEVKP